MKDIRDTNYYKLIKDFITKFDLSTTARINKLQKEFPNLFSDIDTDAIYVNREAQHILTSACKVIAATKQNLEKQPNKQLYLALTENHAQISHSLHHILVIKGLEAEGINIGVSQEHDTPININTELTIDTPDGRSVRSKAVRDILIDNSKYNKYACIFHGYKHSPYSRKLLDKFMLTTHADLQLTDAPRMPKKRGKPTTLDSEILPKHLAQMLAGVTDQMASKEAMRVRNNYSLDKIHTLFSQKSKPDVIVDIMGQAHAYGTILTDNIMEDSKIYIAQTRYDYNTLCSSHQELALATDFAELALAQIENNPHQGHGPESIISKNMPKLAASYAKPIFADQMDINTPSDLPVLNAEMSLVNSWVNAIGLQDLLQQSLPQTFTEALEARDSMLINLAALHCNAR